MGAIRTCKEEVLPSSVPLRMGIEAAVAQGWKEYLGSQSQMISVERFGASAPYEVLAKQYGFTISNIVSKTEAMLSAS